MKVDQIENVPVDIIDDPFSPMRSRMNETKLEELADSIKRHGLIQPITLRRAGKRYEVVAGHRRLKAARLAGLASLPAVIRDIDQQKGDELKIHENLFREDVNPVDEARFIANMVDRYNKTPSELAEMTGKSATYLKARYDLLSYPKYLVMAVENEHIGITAAQWLARIEDANVLTEYTRFAILGGITAKRAEAWYRSWNLGHLPRDPTTFQSATDDGELEERIIEDLCVVCQHKDDVLKMKMVYTHDECERAMKAAANVA